MGQPLAVAGRAAGANLAPGDVAELLTEAAGPLPGPGGRLACDVGGVHDVVAEAGRAGGGAVPAHQADLRDGLPLGVLAIGDQELVQAVGFDLAAHLRRRLPDQPCALSGLGVGGLARADGQEDLPALPRSALHQEPTVDLGEGQVEPLAAVRAGTHRGAEARPPGLLAIDGHDKGPAASLGVEGVLAEHPVLDPDGVQVAGPQAEERVAGRGFVRSCSSHAAAVAFDLQDHLAGGEQEPLRGVWTVREGEEPTVAGAFDQPIPPRFLFDPDAARQLAGVLDAVEHDRAIPNGRPHQVEPAGPKLGQQALEARLVQEPHRLTSRSDHPNPGRGGPPAMESNSTPVQGPSP